MDTFPIPARSLERYYKVDGRTLERNYKEHLSGFREWGQRGHAGTKVLLPQNMGRRLGIDESMHSRDLFTFLINKDGHGKKGTLIASVRGTKASTVSQVLKELPLEARLAVEEVTMDFSDSMHAIVTECFPNATIVIDCFHIMQRVCDGLGEMRMRFKRKAQSDRKKEEKEFKQKQARRKKARDYYRKRHPLKPGRRKEAKKGRPRIRSNQRFVPQTLSNGDTKVELLTRARYILPKSGNDWSKTQKERAGILFELYPKLKDAHSLVCSLRSIFRNKDIDREQARTKLHDWYRKVGERGIKEVISAKDCIKSREEEVLNYFINRSTNAASESNNAKMKGFRSELRGVRDLEFYLYRCVKIFG